MAKPHLSMQAFTFVSKPCDGAGVESNSTATGLFESHEHRNRSRRQIKAIIPPNPARKYPRRVALLLTHPPLALLFRGASSPFCKNISVPI
jgi:hypothetical protein